MTLLRRALLPMAAQVFQYRFDGNFRAVETPLVRLDNLLVPLGGGEQALRGFSKVPNRLTLCPHQLPILFSCLTRSLD